MYRLLLAGWLGLLSFHICVADWPAFMGGADRSESAQFEPPVRWSNQQGIRWQVPLTGHGQSSPVVVADRIYVTAVEGPMKGANLVTCIDLESGRQLWQHKSKSSFPVKNDVYTSRAAPTPVADASGVFAFFESGNLLSFDTNGTLRWERNFLADYGQYEGRFGLGGSLAQTEDRLFVLADNEGPAYLAAIDKDSGQTIWKTDRDSRTAWSSPMIIRVAGEPQVVVSAAGTIDAYAADSGKLLWSFDDVGGNTVASPFPVEDGAFLVGASPGRNGESSEGARRSNLLMRVKKTNDGFEPEVVWINEKVTSSFGSPIAYRGQAYYTNRAGVLFCVDLQSGQTVYTSRLAESNWATPIGVGENVYFFGKDGTTTVMKAGDEEQLVAENELLDSTEQGGPGGFAGEIQYGVAALPDGFIIRTGQRLFRIGN